MGHGPRSLSQITSAFRAELMQGVLSEPVC